MLTHSSVDYATRYLERHFKPRAEHLVGMEVEHICVRVRDGHRIAYAGDESVLTILQALRERLGGERVDVDGHWLELRGEWGKITLEPGNQIEWSSPPRPTCSDLIIDLNHWLQTFSDVLSQSNLMTIAAGSGLTDTRNVPLAPKRRYDLMYRYYSHNAAVAYRAMRNTAGVHVNFDCSGPEDWSKKFRVLLAATPATVAALANSPGYLHQEQYAAVRPMLWHEMDPQRTTLPANAFQQDFFHADYGRWLAHRPLLFQTRDGELMEGSGETLPEEFADEDTAMEQLKAHAGTIFTPVRANGLLEVRSVDTQSDHLLRAIPAFWSGLLYHEQILEEALEVLRPIRSKSDWSRLFTRACRWGKQDRGLLEQFQTLVELAIQGQQALDGPDSRAASALHDLQESLAPSAAAESA